MTTRCPLSEIKWPWSLSRVTNEPPEIWISLAVTETIMKFKGLQLIICLTKPSRKYYHWMPI
jgi:hypothetical protein